MEVEQLALEQNQQTIEDGSKLTNIDDSTAPAAKKQKLTAFNKLLGPQKLPQESITHENELEKILRRATHSQKRKPSYMVES